MSYVLMYKIENADNWQWVFSSDGGQTQIVIETDTQADQPTDLDVRKQVNQGVPSSLKKAMATNARRNLRQAAERKRINNLVIRSYKLK